MGGGRPERCEAAERSLSSKDGNAKPEGAVTGGAAFPFGLARSASAPPSFTESFRKALPAVRGRTCPPSNGIMIVTAVVTGIVVANWTGTEPAQQTVSTP